MVKRCPHVPAGDQIPPGVLVGGLRPPAFTPALMEQEERLRAPGGRESCRCIAPSARTGTGKPFCLNPVRPAMKNKEKE